MSLTLNDIYSQADYLVIEASGLSVYMQYQEEDEGFVLEYDNGKQYLQLSSDTPVEALINGNILMLGTEYRAYVAQQIKFQPEV